MDPNAVVGQPRDYWVWLSPDWSDYREGDTAPAGKAGWTRVKIRETMYNDGRLVRNVLDANGAPVAEGGTAAGGSVAAKELDSTPQYDKDQAKRFKDGQTTAQRGDQEGDIRASSGPTREVYRGGKWVVEPNPVYTPATSTKPTIGRVEGTPIPGGGFDNTKPIWVERDDKNQQVGPAKPLTAAERTQWEKEKNGGKTDAEMAAPDRVGKPTGEVRTTTANGTTKKEIQYVLPDGTKEWRAQTEVGAPDRIGKPTGNTRTKIENGQTIKETEYVLEDGTKDWRAQSAPDETNRPLPAGMPQFRPDPNKAGMGTIEYAQQLAALRSQGKITEAQFKEFVGYAHSQATAEASRLDLIKSAQQQQQTNEITQRATDINASVNRLNSANTATQNALDTSQKMAGNFTNDTYAAAGGPILPAIMALQDSRAQQWGGMYQPQQVGTQGYPVLGQLNQMGMTPNPNTIIPAVAQLGNMGNPNQIGAGAIGSAVAPVTAGVTATNAAATNPTGPNVQAATNATVAGTGAAMGALGVPPVQPAAAAPAAPVAQPVATPTQPAAATPGFVYQPDDMVTIRSATGSTMQVPRSMVGEGPGQYGASPQRGGYQIVESGAPQAMAQPDILSMTPDQAGSAPMPQESPVLPASHQMAAFTQVAGLSNDPDWQEAVREASRQLGWAA